MLATPTAAMTSFILQRDASLHVSRIEALHLRPRTSDGWTWNRECCTCGCAALRNTLRRVELTVVTIDINISDVTDDLCFCFPEVSALSRWRAICDLDTRDSTPWTPRGPLCRRQGGPRTEHGVVVAYHAALPALSSPAPVARHQLVPAHRASAALRHRPFLRSSRSRRRRGARCRRCGRRRPARAGAPRG